MTVATEIPITEDDISVIEERKVVELSGEKFKELLDYVTHIEDALSIAEFDLSSERRFADLLIDAFANSITSIRWENDDEVGKTLSQTRYAMWERRLAREVRDGHISDDQFRRFREAFVDSLVVGDEKCAESSNG
jgi:hypothetical protein